MVRKQRCQDAGAGELRRLLDHLYGLAGALAAAFLVAICAVVTVQVGLNLIDRAASLLTGSAIGLTIPSYADFTGFFLVAASFLALAYTFRRGGHIRVSLIIHNLPAGTRRLVEIWCVALALAASAYFTVYTGFMVRDSFTYMDVSPGMVPVPIWIPQAAMLVGLAIFTIALADEFIGLICGREPTYAGKGDDLLAGHDPAPPPDVGDGDV